MHGNRSLLLVHTVDYEAPIADNGSERTLKSPIAASKDFTKIKGSHLAYAAVYQASNNTSVKNRYRNVSIQLTRKPELIEKRTEMAINLMQDHKKVRSGKVGITDEMPSLNHVWLVDFLPC